MSNANKFDKNLNYYTYVNGYYSQIRNVALIASVGIATMGFSNHFKEYALYIQITAFCMLVFSIMYGIKANMNFTQFLSFLDEHKPNNDPPLSFHLENWRDWSTYTYIFIMILVVISVITFKRKIRFSK